MLPRNSIVVQSPRMGGGFGGKEVQGNTFAALVALAAVKTGKPVRMQLDRDLDMTITGKRHPFHSKFSAGYDDQGRLLAVRVDIVSDGGWSLDLSQPIMDRALFHLDNVYYIPAVAFTGRVARTNTTSHTAFRGFGGPQGMLVIEEIMDRVARRLGLPPEVVRERNLYHGTGETNTTHYGEEIGDNRLQTMWKQALDQAGFRERRREIDAWNRQHDRVKRGLAITGRKVRDLLHAGRLQPGGRARADLPGRHRPGEPRRHGDGPGPAHQGPRRRDARAGPPGLELPHDADQHGQGAQHLGHRRLLGRRT